MFHLETDTKFAIPYGILRQHEDWQIEVVSHSFSNAITRRLISPNGESRFLKMVKRNWYPGIKEEVARIQWATNHLPVPEILQVNLSDKVPWMLTKVLPGGDGNQPDMAADPARLVQMLAHALRHFHEMPVNLCPFDFRLDAALWHASSRLKAGLIDPKLHFHKEFQHLSENEAIQILHDERPRFEELVVCHGDFCVPNILFHKGTLSGFIDLGELGVADVWWDLAVATWSLEWNLGAGFEELFLKEYGQSTDVEKIQYFRLLYEVVS